MSKEEKLETIWELKKGDLYVEVARGLSGVYLSLNKRNMGIVLTVEEASYLRTLILRAMELEEEFESEPEIPPPLVMADEG